MTNSKPDKREQFIFRNMHQPVINVIETGYLPEHRCWNYFNSFSFFWKLYCNNGAETSIEFENEIFPFTDSALVLIPPFTRYNTHSAGSFNHFFIHFHLHELENCVERRPWNLPVDGALLRRIIDMMKTGKTHAPKLPFCVDALVKQAVGMLPDEAFCTRHAASDLQTDPRIARAIELLMARRGKPFSNMEIARSVAMSVQNFSRLFQHQIGNSPQKFQRIHRIQFCADELNFTSKSIEEIAQTWGFTDRYHFSKTFKHYYGISPIAYRKRKE